MELTAKQLFKDRYSTKMQGNLVKEPGAFDKMYKDAGKVYFSRLVGFFGEHVNDRFLESDQVDVITPLIEQVQVRIHEKFVTGKRAGAWMFMEHLGTLSTHLSSVRHLADLPRRGGSNNPFFAVSTMECFRYLFGNPDEVSYAVALLFAEDYLHFGGAVHSLAMRSGGSYPDFKWTISDDWVDEPGIGYESYLVTAYLGHPGYPKLFSSPGVAKTARANYEECIAATRCDCACFLCQASRHKCVEVCLAPWPYHYFDSCDNREASVADMAKELTEVAVEHSPFCTLEISTKKPKEEFELWGAYWHQPELFDIFSLNANNTGLLFDRVQGHLLEDFYGINWEMAFPANFPKALEEFVLKEVEQSKIGMILQTTRNIVHLLEEHCNAWQRLAREENATGDSDIKVALKNKLKAVALKVSAGLQSTKALMPLLSRACHFGDDEYKLGPSRFRGLKTDIQGIVRGMLQIGLPNHDDPSARLDLFSEWIWALKLLYMTSKTVYQDKTLFHLEAVVGLTSVADVLEENYLLCCKARIAGELVACGFDQRVISVAKLACRQFFLQHGPKIQGYLKNYKDDGYVKTLTEKLTGANPEKNLVSIENKPTAPPETNQKKEEPLGQSSTPVDKPKPVANKKKRALTPIVTNHTSNSTTKGPVGLVKPRTAAAAAYCAKVRAGKSTQEKKPDDDVPFRLHIANSAQRLLMLTKQLPCPNYDETLEDGAFILFCETAFVIPHYISYAFHQLDKRMHGEFLQNWREKETVLIRAVSTALVNGKTSKIPAYPNAVELLEKDGDLLTLACLRGKKFVGTQRYHLVKAVVDRWSKNPIVADIFSTKPVDGGADSALRKEVDGTFKTAASIARSFDVDMNVALSLTVSGKTGSEVAG